MATVSGSLSSKRLMVNRLMHSKCGVCGRSIDIGEVCSWDSFDSKGNKVRCVEAGGCWAGKFSPEDIASKRSGHVVVSSVDAAAIRPSQAGPVSVPEPVAAVQPQASESSAFGVLADAIAPYLDSKLNSKVDESRVRSIMRSESDSIIDRVEQVIASEVKRQYDAYPPIKIECRVGQQVVGKISGHVHSAVPKVLSLFGAGIRNIYIHGAPGGGKTHMAQQISESLGVRFVPIQLSKVSAESAIKGFVDANGTKQEQSFIDGVRSESLIFWDEFDRAGVHLQALANSFLANNYLVARGYEDPIERHERCYFLAAGNTTLRGRDEYFPEAQASEFSTMDRLAYVHVDYDENLERNIVRGINPDAEPWLDWVLKIRPDAMSGKHGRVVATPRASYEGARILRFTDFTPSEVADVVVFKGIARETKDVITSRYPLPNIARSEAHAA